MTKCLKTLSTISVILFSVLFMIDPAVMAYTDTSSIIPGAEVIYVAATESGGQQVTAAQPEKLDAAPSAPTPAQKQPPMPELPKNLTKAYITLAVLLLAGVSFFMNKFHPAVTAMLVACAVSLFGLASTKEAFINFGQINVVTFMAFFVLGEACFATGFANVVGEWVHKKSKGNLKLLVVLIVLVFGLFSSLLSNAGVVAMALPMVLGVAKKSDINPGKLLLPLTYAASMGGCITLIGTPPNLITNATIQEFGAAYGIQPFGFFEWGIMGIPLLLCTVLYYATIGIKGLPDTYPSEENLADANERNARRLRTEKMPHCLIIFGSVLVCMIFGFMPLVTAAMLGAMLVVITGCITMREAFRGIDWTTVFIMAGMIGLGTAMEKTGAALLVATKILEFVSNPYAILAAVCLLSAFLTNLMSNAGCAALLSPLFLTLAVKAGISPLPILMGMAVGISACFMTPIGTPSNTMVFGAGNYTFMHFVKAGWPLQLIAFGLSMLIIPVAWPFHP